MSCASAMAATAAMSTRVRVGFEGVSIQISFVSGRIRSVMVVSIVAVNVTLTLCAEATLVK